MAPRYCKVETCDSLAKKDRKYCCRHVRQMEIHGRITNANPSNRCLNEIKVCGDIARIQLRDSDGVQIAEAIIDAVLLPRVKGIKWYLGSHGYATARCKAHKGYLHRLVSDAPEGSVVDHADMDKLNNRLSNLRVCSQSKNIANSQARKSSKTGIKGVHPYKGGPKFCAQITHEGRMMHLGVFETKKEAAHAYRLKAAELFGEFARC